MKQPGRHPYAEKSLPRFAAKMGWVIVGEEQETGVSGYKVSADDRDKLQLIKKYAEQGKFDILLVFMFDRLGRKSDETPFVVEWFTKRASASGAYRKESSGLSPTRTA